MIRVGIVGCAGRMGQALVQAINAATDIALVRALEQKGAPEIGLDAGTISGLPPLGIAITDDLNLLFSETDGILDFSRPAATLAVAKACAQHKVPLVSGTTGFSADELMTLRQLSQATPLVISPNMSLGINLLFHLAHLSAKLLGTGYDLEIIEAHHNKKVDAPSGTALRLAQILAEATSGVGPLTERYCDQRQGHTGRRPPQQIGMSVIRGGDIVGEHTVLYCGTGERLELTHRASSRQALAQGALHAARWIIKQRPGLYDMQDVLDLR